MPPGGGTAGGSSQLAVTSTVRVRYADTDQMGVAYHANYLVWFEVARCEWLRALGWTYRDMEASGVSLPVIEAQCEYRRPARYDDELEISAVADVLSPVRVEFRYTVVRRADRVTAATGRTVHAAIGTGGKPCRLPERIKARCS